MINTILITNKIINNNNDSHLVINQVRIKLYYQHRVHNGHVIIIKDNNKNSYRLRNYFRKKAIKQQHKRASMMTHNKDKYHKISTHLLMIMYHQ